jgi:histidine ammonia-lyase
MDTLILDGKKLTPELLHEFVNTPSARVAVADANWSAIKKSRKFLDKESMSKIIYGVNTGFGPMASHIISSDKLADLQENLVRSHATGAGDPIKSEYVLAAMVVRLNTIIKGHSGVSEELVHHFVTVINQRIIPIIPEHGAVGTSGDLVQLAHIALILIGEGDVIYKGKKTKTKTVFKKLKIKPYVLKPKEGLALINGTAVMSAIASLLIVDARKLIDLSISSGAFALEMVRGFSDAISAKLHAVRPHKGQVEVAKRLRSILKTSKFLQNRPKFNKNQAITRDTHEIQDDVQNFYSFRCIPQIVGPVLTALWHAEDIVQVEINSVTDNPIIDTKNSHFLHGGNFHGDYIAYAVDQLKMALVKLTMLSERRVNFFLHSKINDRFTPFLNLDTPGLTLALQGMQFVATSTTAQSQTLAYPQYVHSIPTNADNQDVVSMGTDAALLLSKVVENAFIVIAIELACLSQALDLTNTKHKLASETRDLYNKVRKVFPAVKKDRYMRDELDDLIKLISS